MTNGKLLIAAALVCFAQTGMAQTNPQTDPQAAPQVTTQSEPGKVVVTGKIKTVSTIVGIEPSTRTVWLKNHQGKVVEVVVGEEAHNFDQLKVGDVVTAEYTQALTVNLKKTNAPLTANETETLARSEPGAKPGGSAAREITVIANVTAVNQHTGAITLKGPKGNSVDLMVQDPEQLKRIRKGDQIEVVYNEAVAISVEPQAKK